MKCGKIQKRKPNEQGRNQTKISVGRHLKQEGNLEFWSKGYREIMNIYYEMLLFLIYEIFQQT